MFMRVEISWYPLKLMIQLFIEGLIIVFLLDEYVSNMFSGEFGMVAANVGLRSTLIPDIILAWCVIVFTDRCFYTSRMFGGNSFNE
jgi:hypothetical protein